MSLCAVGVVGFEASHLIVTVKGLISLFFRVAVSFPSFHKLPIIHTSISHSYVRSDDEKKASNDEQAHSSVVDGNVIRKQEEH